MSGCDSGGSGSSTGGNELLFWTAKWGRQGQDLSLPVRLWHLPCQRTRLVSILLVHVVAQE